MNINYATISKRGRRSNNEDAFRIVRVPGTDRFMAMVCDGMGGHAMGEVASEMICDCISGYWMDNPEFGDCEAKVREACKDARVAFNRKAYDLGDVQMGTTMVMASIEDDRVVVAHIGDSRCYLQRPGQGVVYQTRDHVRIDYGWEVVARCFFSFRPEVAVPDVVRYELQAGDRLLLCSDGLYKGIAPNILLARMMDNKPLADILDAYDFLCERQSDDNYTAILIEVTD